MVDYNCSAPVGLFGRVAYIPVFTISLSFNLTALCIFCRIKRWTDTHIYMLNLMAADFLAIIFMPFRILEAFCPITPTLLCTFLLCIQFFNMYCSIFTITAISVHRFIVIRFPFLAKAMASKRKLIATSQCIFIWVSITVISATNYQNMNPDHLKDCYDLKLKDKLKIHFFLLLEILGCLLPVLTVIFCSTQTIFILVKSLQRVSGKDRAERRKITAVIAANMFTFIVCFTPVHIGLLMQYLLQDEVKGDFVYRFLHVTEWLATTNCCLDSIGFYFLLKRVHKRNNSSQ